MFFVYLVLTDLFCYYMLFFINDKTYKMSKKRTVIINLRIDQEDHNIIADIAQKEARPINNHYRMITGKWINENTDFESVFVEKNKQVVATDDLIDSKVKMLNVSLRLDEHDYDVIKERATKDARSFNMQVRYMLGKYIELTGDKSAVFGDVSKDNKYKDNWSEGF